VESSFGASVLLELQPRAASKASVSGVDFEDDSRYGLVWRKRLTDFGRSASRREVAGATLEAKQAIYEAGHDRQTLEIMERFFAVTLADYAYQMHDERMAISYFRYTRMLERQTRFEQYSDLEVAEREVAYRQQYVARLQADLQRRQTRHQLALALGRPGELSSELVIPDLAVYRKREIPRYADLVERVILSSAALQFLRHEVAAAKAAIDVARKLHSPVLSAELEAREYANSTSSSRDRYRANLKFSMPLFDGTGGRDIEVALAQNTLLHKQAALASSEYAVREEVLVLLHELEVNRAEEAAAQAQETYRGYYQDRSRAMYELELRSDLGDAQAAAAEAMLESIRVDFERALLWAQLDSLLGLPSALIQEN
jgi:outer membrane protein TolC